MGISRSCRQPAPWKSRTTQRELIGTKCWIPDFTSIQATTLFWVNFRLQLIGNLFQPDSSFLPGLAHASLCSSPIHLFAKQARILNKRQYITGMGRKWLNFFWCTSHRWRIRWAVRCQCQADFTEEMQWTQTTWQRTGWQHVLCRKNSETRNRFLLGLLLFLYLNTNFLCKESGCAELWQCAACVSVLRSVYFNSLSAVHF